MNPTAIEVFSTFGVGVLCVVMGIMALVLFLKALNRWGGSGAQPDTIAIRGVLKKDTWAKVYMVGQETFDHVRFMGFTNTESFKSQLPYELNGLVILEDERGCRFIVRAKSIRMIVVEADNHSGDRT